jgi:hypothetical protein
LMAEAKSIEESISYEDCVSGTYGWKSLNYPHY